MGRYSQNLHQVKKNKFSLFYFLKRKVEPLIQHLRKTVKEYEKKKKYFQKDSILKLQ